MKICKNASRQVCKSENMQLGEYKYEYANIQAYKCASKKVCDYENFHVCRYAGMQVYKYTNLLT